MRKVVRLLVIVALGLLSAASGLIASAARSDFLFRGCADIPRDTWDMTANCADGWFAQVVFGSLALVSLLAICLILIRAFVL